MTCKSSQFGWLIVLLLLAHSATLGQQYPFVKIDLPNAPKGDGFIGESDQGGLWILGGEAGGEGAIYFDGSRFVPIIQGRTIAKSTFVNDIGKGIAEDADHGLWIATMSGILHVHDSHVDRIVEGHSHAILRVAPNIFLASSTPTGTAGKLIRIAKTGNNWKWDTLLSPFPDVRLQLTAARELLFPCSGGYCQIEASDVAGWSPGEKLRVSHYSIQLPPSVTGETGMIWRDRSGCVWFHSVSKVSYLCRGDDSPINLSTAIATLGGASFGELSDGSVVIPSYNKIAIGRPGRFRIISAQHGFGGAAYVWVGKDDTIWITNFNGLFAFFPHQSLEFWTEREGLEGNPWSILPQNNTVLAAAGDAIQILGKDRERWRIFVHVDGVNRLEPGPHGTLIAGSRLLGIAQFDSAGQVLRRSPPLEVWSMARAPGGKIWAAGKGVSELVLKPRSIDLNPVVPAQSSGDYLVKFDATGRAWICNGAGLSYLGDSGWQSVSAGNATANPSCWQFAVSGAQEVWYASDAPLLSLVEDFDSGHPTIRNFESRGEIGPAHANFLSTDRRGWLWRGTPNGLYVASSQQAKNGYWFHMDRMNGLPGVDTNQQSFREDNDGSVWFSADNSIIHFAPPADFLHPKYAPAVFVSAFSLNGGAPQLVPSIGAIPNNSDITALLGSLQMDRRNALHVRYRIQPDQSAWTDSTDLNLHLGKLPHGTHKLEVQAELGDGPWSQSVSQTFTVLKPFWLTWPFLAGMAIAGVATGTAGNAWYKRHRERSQKLLPDLAEWRIAALAPEIQALQGGLLDSRFEVGALLARGGFAAVVEGRDLEHDGRRCAIKIFRQEWADKEWLTKRFRQEVQALEQIHHPNVVSFFGHGSTPSGAPYLVMEFIEGTTLREHLGAGGISPVLTATYLRQIGSALAEIHRHGTCHRDLKPENLMVRDHASPGHEIVLIDFSIAMVKDPDETLHGLSRAAGTLYYMAPEQGIGYADASTDIYSLAKIVIEMLTGSKLSDLLPNASIDLPQQVRDLLATLPVRLSPASIDLLSRALEFHPLRRPSDAHDFSVRIADDLQGSNLDSV